MGQQRKHEDWLRDLHERQRNFVFPDTVRNVGGFWRGIYEQKLNLVQSVGLIILVLFYVTLLVGSLPKVGPPGRKQSGGKSSMVMAPMSSSRSLS
jgi:hypothetical protein